MTVRRRGVQDQGRDRGRQGQALSATTTMTTTSGNGKQRKRSSSGTSRSRASSSSSALAVAHARAVELGERQEVSDGAVYVYGVTHRGRRGLAVGRRRRGLAGARRSATATSPRWSATSRGGALAAAREVRAHWRVLEAIAASTTVLPVRFGTVMASDEAVRADLLAAERRAADRRCSTELAGTRAGRRSRAPTTRTSCCAASSPVARRSPRCARGCSAARGRPATTSGSGWASWSPPRSRACASRMPRSRCRGSSRSRSPRARRSAGAADAAFNLAFLVERARLDEFSAAVDGADRGARRPDRRALRRAAAALQLRRRRADGRRRRDGPVHRDCSRCRSRRCGARSGSPRSCRSRPSSSCTTSRRSRRRCSSCRSARESGRATTRAEIEEAEDALIERLMELRGYRRDEADGDIE